MNCSETATCVSTTTLPHSLNTHTSACIRKHTHTHTPSHLLPSFHQICYSPPLPSPSSTLLPSSSFTHLPLKETTPPSHTGLPVCILTVHLPVSSGSLPCDRWKHVHAVYPCSIASLFFLIQLLKRRQKTKIKFQHHLNVFYILHLPILHYKCHVSRWSDLLRLKMAIDNPVYFSSICISIILQFT